MLTSTTSLFAVDGDLDQVVFRSRKGSSPTYSSEFGFWKSMGTPKAGADLTRIAACSGDSGARPQVFVVADDPLGRATDEIVHDRDQLDRQREP